VLAALRVGLVEELAKLAPVLPIALFAVHFDEALDGIIYSACAALGFATAETVVALRGGEWSLIHALGRAVAAPLTHALISAPAGLGLAALVLKRRPAGLVLGVMISVLAHASYDLFLARPGMPPAAAAAVVLLLWLWLLRATPQLAKLEPTLRRTSK
jgi:RsiW-degrading membrane proteinase PrsW (M82 family)